EAAGPASSFRLDRLSLSQPSAGRCNPGLTGHASGYPTFLRQDWLPDRAGITLVSPNLRQNAKMSDRDWLMPKAKPLKFMQAMQRSTPTTWMPALERWSSVCQYPGWRQACCGLEA